MYDKAVAKLTVSELQGALPDFGTGSEEIVSAIENGVLEKEGNLVTVSCVLPLGTGDIPLVFGFSETDGKVEWKYINASLSVFGQEISATVEPSSEKVQFDPVIADDAVDMTLFAKDLADFSSLKALTGSADYATDAQDVHIDANIENAESGFVPVKADVAVSVQNYKTDDTGAAIRDENNARTPDGGHFVHAILADDVLYLSYSLVSLDAETALRVKISMFDLMMSGMELINILNDVFGFDLGGILSAATLTQESAPIALQSMFTTGVARPLRRKRTLGAIIRSGWKTRRSTAELLRLRSGRSKTLRSKRSRRPSAITPISPSSLGCLPTLTPPPTTRLRVSTCLGLSMLDF